MLGITSKHTRRWSHELKVQWKGIDTGADQDGEDERRAQQACELAREVQRTSSEWEAEAEDATRRAAFATMEQR